MFEGSSKCGTRVADGKGNELHPSPIRSEGRDEGGYFSVFLSNLASQSRYLQKRISTMMRVHYFMSKEVGSGEGVIRTPLEYMRSGAVPCPASNHI